MLASELLGARVVDDGGRPIGRVHDVRLAKSGERLRVTGLVIGGESFRTRAAHAWGYSEGRAAGPWLVRAILSPGIADSAFVPIEDVLTWAPGEIAVSARREQTR